MDDEDAPDKIEKRINAFGGPIKASRKVRDGAASTHMPDFVKMVSVGKRGRGQDSLNKPYDSDFLNNPLGEQHAETEKPRLTYDIQKMMSTMGSKINIPRKSLLSEVFSDDDDNFGEP